MKIGIINHQQSFLIYNRFYGSDCITCRAKLRDQNHDGQQMATVKKKRQPENSVL
jgi:hypothetical protein